MAIAVASSTTTCGCRSIANALYSINIVDTHTDKTKKAKTRTPTKSEGAIHGKKPFVLEGHHSSVHGICQIPIWLILHCGDVSNNLEKVLPCTMVLAHSTPYSICSKFARPEGPTHPAVFEQSPPQTQHHTMPRCSRYAVPLPKEKMKHTDWSAVTSQTWRNRLANVYHVA